MGWNWFQTDNFLAPNLMATKIIWTNRQKMSTPEISTLPFKRRYSCFPVQFSNTERRETDVSAVISSNSWQQSWSYCNSFIRPVIKSNDSVAHNKRFICSNLTARVEIKYFRLIDNKNLFRFVWIKTVMPMSFSCPVTWWTGSSVRSTSRRISFRFV